MVTLVIGGSGSGKSAFAEDLLSDYKGEKYYIATMQVADLESERRVERHKRLRANKNFITIEQSDSIGETIYRFQSQRCVALLECVSNLVANEMFKKDKINSVDDTVGHILASMKQIINSVEDLIIVSNNVAEDGLYYDETTIEYIHAIGDLNVALAEMADRVVEVSMGLPLWLK